MTAPMTFKPALCRRSLLPDDLLRDVEDFISRSASHGMMAITQPLITDGENLYAMTSVRFVMRTADGVRHAAPTETNLPGALETEARDIALRLMVTDTIARELEEVDSDFIVFQRQGIYCLTFYPGCAILYPDDPAGRLEGDPWDLTDNPNLVESRAAICTLILSDAQSYHQRIAQSSRALQALQMWRATTDLTEASLVKKTGLLMALPTRSEIATCEIACIARSIE